MKIIAHRANINGSNSLKENRLSQIIKCIEFGYEVEFDIRFINNNLYLGHDNPDEIISEKELFKLKEKCWIHCKNLDAILYFNKAIKSEPNSSFLYEQIGITKFKASKSGYCKDWEIASQLSSEYALQLLDKFCN